MAPIVAAFHIYKEKWPKAIDNLDVLGKSLPDTIKQIKHNPKLTERCLKHKMTRYEPEICLFEKNERSNDCSRQ